VRGEIPGRLLERWQRIAEKREGTALIGPDGGVE
jgi:hypothetical protein